MESLGGCVDLLVGVVEKINVRSLEGGLSGGGGIRL